MVLDSEQGPLGVLSNETLKIQRSFSIENAKELDQNKIFESVKDVAILDQDAEGTYFKYVIDSTPEEIQQAQEQKRLITAHIVSGKIDFGAEEETARLLSAAIMIEYRGSQGTQVFLSSNFSVREMTNDESKLLNTAINVYIVYLKTFPREKDNVVNEDKNNSEKNSTHKKEHEPVKKKFKVYSQSDTANPDDAAHDAARALAIKAAGLLYELAEQNLKNKEIQQKAEEKIDEAKHILAKEILIKVVNDEELKRFNLSTEILSNMNIIYKISTTDLDGKKQAIVYLNKIGKSSVK